MRLPIKDLDHDLDQFSAVLMGHHLVVMVHDTSANKDRSSPRPNDLRKEEPATLFAIDLLDNSVQEQIMSNFDDQRNSPWPNTVKIRSFGLEAVRDLLILLRLHSSCLQSFRLIVRNLFEIYRSNHHSAFLFKFETLQDRCWNKPILGNHIAQIYKDRLYIYGGFYERNHQTDLWCYDLSLLYLLPLLNHFCLGKRIWELCETTGEGPGSLLLKFCLSYLNT